MPDVSIERHRRHPRHTSPHDTWNRESIVAALRDWHRETRTVPLSIDWCPSTGRSLGQIGARETRWEAAHPRWPGSTTVYRYFASWSEALVAAGLPPRTRPHTMPFAERVAAAKRLRAAGLSVREIADAIDVCGYTVSRYLRAHTCRACITPVVGDGALCAACATRAANPRRWSREELLELAAAWLLETGRLPRSTDWSRATAPPEGKWHREFPRWPPASVARQAFGGWNAFRGELGGPVYQPPWTSDEVLEAISRWVSVHGAPPTKTQWECPPAGYPSAPTVRRRFGSFVAGVKAAGYESAKPSWDRDSIVEAIWRFEEAHERPPLPRDWQRAQRDYPQANSMLRHFGSWEAGLRAADEARPRLS